MEILQTSVILGITLGMLFALSSAGLVVIYRTSGYVSFAQGDVATAALFVGLLVHEAGWPYWVLALIVISSGVAISLVVGMGVVTPIERHGLLSAALSTIAVSLVIQGLLNLTSGGHTRAFPALSDARAFRLGDVALQWTDVAAFGCSVIAFVALGVAFRRSNLGIAMRAMSDNELAAELLGLSRLRLKACSWAVAGALAGILGLFVAPIYSLTPQSIDAFLVFGFAAIIAGGFDSIVGAMVAGVVIGVLTNLVSAYLDPNLVPFSLYVLILVILLVRPQGLFGRSIVSRV
ncbi:MAG TPA: branched-chain amino acid ABC transporter permease [Marmoricola sp.]|jgi:branched-chain amino acid transport system permease protein|nr:branched-chain amino acid ABC transporter permease [Marmoricola sp.]